MERHAGEIEHLVGYHHEWRILVFQGERLRSIERDELGAGERRGDNCLDAVLAECRDDRARWRYPTTGRWRPVFLCEAVAPSSPGVAR
jgi:hypothetical protein